MAEEQRDLIRALWWLCAELRAGQTFKDGARAVLQGTIKPMALPPTKTGRDAAFGRAFARFRSTQTIDDDES